MKVYKNGSCLLGNKIVKADIAANRGKIIEIAADIVPDAQTEVIDCSGRFILPAMVDVHATGACGLDFNTADLDGMRKMLDYFVSQGVGTLFPTLHADADQNLCRQIQLICQLAKDYPEVKGIRLDGPFISPEYCGDIPKQYLCKPSVDKFMLYQNAANGFIKIVTVSPELPDAIAFISEVSDMGVVVSLGNSGANSATVLQALKAGAKSFSRWGSDMSPLTASDLNVAGTALYSNAFCELLCDGSVQKDVFKFVVQTKTENKTVGVTCGSPNAYDALANTVTFTSLPLHVAIKIWTTSPAALVGLSHRIGTIEVGKDADFILFG